MTYTPHTPADVRLMLERIGAGSVEELFADIPAELRYPELDLPPALSEPEADALLRRLAGRNRTPHDGPWFLGGGVYNHYIPAVVGALASRGEFMTAYTPYQPEVSQGTLQALFEYQSMVGELVGLPAVNASHYDGATALAEAVLMAWHAAGGPAAPAPPRVLLPAGLNPVYRPVVEAYAGGLAVELVGYDGDPRSALPAAAAAGPLAALVVQSPDFLGNVWDLAGLADAVHAAGGLLVVHTDPIMLGLFQAPGRQGADIVCAEGQCLGIPMSFGGPSLGIMGCAQSLVRRLPGRLVGQAFDAKGRRGFTLTLSAREQHIRREKAVSNICSNQGLMALSACIYLAAMGPAGMRRVAEACWRRAHALAEAIDAIPGYRVPALRGEAGWSRHFFKEFAVECPADAAALAEALRRERGIEAGLPLARSGLADADRRVGQLLVCATELTTADDIAAFARALADHAGGDS